MAERLWLFEADGDSIARTLWTRGNLVRPREAYPENRLEDNMPNNGIDVADVQKAGFWIAASLQWTAQWREAKTEDYPDDARNPRAAQALHAAERYVRTKLQQSDGVNRMADLVQAASEAGIDLLAGGVNVAGLPGVDSQRVASRYFFDNTPGEPDDHTHEELLRDLYRASLRDLSDYDWDVEGDSKLGRLVKAQAGRAAPTDPVVERLTEIRDLMFDRLPAVRGASRKAPYRPNVRWEVFPEYDHVGTPDLKVWLRYWKGVDAGTQPLTPGSDDTPEMATGEIIKLSAEIESRASTR